MVISGVLGGDSQSQRNGIQLGLHAVGPGGDDDGRFGADDQAGVSGVGQEDHGFIKYIAGFNIGYQQDIGMTGAGVGDALVPGGLGGDGVIQRQRPDDGAAGQLAA